MRFDDDALWIVRALESSGHEAYLVGGCVRDALLGRAPKDTDVSTGAPPGETTRLFASLGCRVLQTGPVYGTVTVLRGGKSFEVTVFRADGTYSDGRRPDSVEFSGGLTADLSRRDFTINAMAWHPERGLIDPFGGRDDLEKKCIRAVGAPGRRFSEDALRMLRAVRFAAELGFTLAPATMDALNENAGRAAALSSERVLAELLKTICAGHARAFALLPGTGLLDVVLPELVPVFADTDPAGRALTALELAEPVSSVRMAALFLGLGATAREEASRALARLRAPKALCRDVETLLRLSGEPKVPGRPAVKRVLNALGDLPPGRWLSLERAADVAAGRGNGRADNLETLCRDIVSSEEAYTLKRLAVGGGDAVAAGLRGPDVGLALARCLGHVIENPGDNRRDVLTALLKLMKNCGA